MNKRITKNSKKKIKPTKLSRQVKPKVKRPASVKKPKNHSKSTIENVVVVSPETKPIKRRKKSTEKMYFTEDTERAVVRYNNSECQDEREKIFREEIQYPFEKLVENIFNKFKFSYFETGPLDVQKETVSHLMANVHKFDKNKGKAFSFFSIVAKHYLIFLNNTNYKRFNQSVEIGEDREEHTVQLQSEDKHYKDVEMSEYMQMMISYWETNVGKLFSKQRDLNIANAVIELFRNSDRIDAFNKKALYLYIREISNCKTQQITKVINKMKQCHVNIARSYVNNGVVSQLPQLNVA
jgi:hypothetical protein